MLQIGDSALEVLRDTGGLRLSVVEVGGDELELQIEHAEEPVEGDDVVERDGAKVFLDPTASDALTDQVLEVEPHGDHVHFEFSPQPE